MKQLLLSFFICLMCFAVASCNSSEIAPVKEKKIDVFCDSFISAHKNWNQNEIINSKANIDLRDSLKTNLSRGLLSDFPLKLYRINEYEQGKFAAHLNTDYTTDTKYKLTFDVIALVSKQDVEKLKSDSSYSIDGNFKRFLLDDYRNYSDGLANTPAVQIRKDYDTVPDFDLGIILMDNVALKRTN